MASKKKIMDNLKKLRPLHEFLRSYHRYETRGLEHVPKTGPALIVMNHSLATYDVGLLYMAILEQYQRIVRSLAGHLFFKFPYLGDWVENVGAVDGEFENALALLKKGELVGLCPGGVPEATKPSREAYDLKWHSRRGFIKLAIMTQTPIILAMCPRADDLYKVYDTPKLRSWVYNQFKAPFFLARGVGLSPLPRPIKLIHWLSEPIMPPKPVKNIVKQNLLIRDFHALIVSRAEELMRHGLAYDEDKDSARFIRREREQDHVVS